jgi:hypothetical protein
VCGALQAGHQARDAQVDDRQADEKAAEEEELAPLEREGGRWKHLQLGKGGRVDTMSAM